MHVAGVGLALVPPSVLTRVALGPAVAHGGLTHEGAGLALEPIIGAHRVRRGLAAVDLVRWHQINVCLEWTAPWEEYIALISR